ncbi:MAG TPA: helix-turn-helix transcriptional regulator [Pseudonocardiaceae bacterium]|nr:helix-turn-helix transcriptional regulator [Pseudonocardiaceae bacterium]
MSKTPKGMRLARALRDARESRGFTLRELGAMTGRNSGALSRYESGERTPKPEDVAQLLTALEIRGQEYDEVLALAYDTDGPGWAALTLPDQRQHLLAMIDMEQSATHIDHVAPSIFPGLLQSESYMTAIMVAAGMAGKEVVTRVATRLTRQDALEKPQPVDFMSFLGEAALYWLIGGREVMVDQLRHVLRLCERPNVRVRIVPFESGWHTALDGGALMIMDRSIVHRDAGKSGIFLHNREDVRSCIDAVAELDAVSLSEAKSHAVLAARLRVLERTP